MKLIADHRSLNTTPPSAMTLSQLEAERAELRECQVDTTTIQVGAYRWVVEKAIQDRLTEINAAISNQTYQKEA